MGLGSCAIRAQPVATQTGKAPQIAIHATDGAWAGSGILPRLSLQQMPNRVRTMDYHHSHNLVEPEKAGVERRFGIRVTLPATDTLRNILGDDWERLHWFPTESERNAAFTKMATRHGYYRNSDTPTQILEKIAR